MDGSRISEENEQLLEDYNREDGSFNRLPKRRQSCWPKVSRGAFEALLVCCILLLSAVLFIVDGREVHIPTVIPRFHQTKEYWEYESTNSIYTDPEMFLDPQLRDEMMKDWLDRLLPTPSRGFVVIENPERFNLPPPRIFPEDGKPKYQIAVFHQLHCLSHLLRAFSAARLGEEFPYDKHHLAHCFDYLRQNILCAADPSLEGNKTATPGAHHVCNNFGALKAWAIEHAAPNVPHVPFIG
ncbi:putative Oxidase ustYa [Seiridium unicorne]|uniref:Oxidase ustYa n=1 Tax=Seiridium unicorne TaxID=138068 RepID=A0ABR2VBZ4_9PEZI